jgi:hypothetical protein
MAIENPLCEAEWRNLEGSKGYGHSAQVEADGSFSCECDHETGTARHATAALALYGQSWGFRENDLAILDLAIQKMSHPSLIREAQELRDRIAALLPLRFRDGR